MMRGATRGRYLGALLLMVTFVAGALVGAAANRVLEARPVTALASAPVSAGCADRDPDIFATLALTPEQRERVDEVLARRREQADAFWKESGPRLSELMDSTRAEIRTVLTPEQRAEYDRLRAERRERHEKRNRID
jgi:Spy/CpxP family protein refolding chaperone